MNAVKDEYVLEGVEIVVKQIDRFAPSEIRSKEESSSGEEPTRAGLEWKRYLSGALSDEQLYMAMFVLCIFYFVYTLYNAFLDSNKKDEGDVIRNCTCKDGHRNFYLSWSITCFTLWLICHSCYTLAETFPAVTKSLKATVMLRVRNCMENYVQIHWKYDDENDSGSAERKLKKMTDQHIDQCEKFLWTQCYEMYAVGIKKRNEQLNLTEMEKLIAISLSPEICKKKSLSKGDSQPENTDNVAHDLSHNFHIVKRASLCLFHSFLVVVRFIAQLSTVPLLIIQMFDTYTLLCLAERDYCDRISQYRLHLDQTALSFSFYCSLMISLLVTIWLNLVPQPKLEVYKCTLYRGCVASKAFDKRTK